MATGRRGQTAAGRGATRWGRGTTRGGRGAHPALALRPESSIAHGARIQHLETLQRQAKATIGQLKQELETARLQSANDAQQLRQELETSERMSKIRVSLLKKQHDAAQRQSKVVLLQLKQYRETVKRASGIEIEQLAQELEALRATQERKRTEGARLNVRIKNMDEDELRGLYESEFAATDAAQRQEIQRLEAEFEVLKGKLKLADDQATEREKVMIGHVELIEQYKRHLADVKLSG
ncbi:hypothetical protein B0A48_05962 [Cryoendolithus antarcticus]|uniref:Uncharacterized protein n=1 Tax=Cryoendolithus antarcticus TaxID=1507870 RepID=A0A1V8TCU1_9PEZI|nr:hypothetical protein B0A48_05962 [Cryoendolithus antarcticus]